jgi:MFS transporter, FSR family, fosmidomycin resistance protein
MMKDENSKSGFQWNNVILISFAHLLHDVFSSFFVPLLPFINDKLNLSNLSVGILKVTQRLPSLFSPFIGILADKFPLRIFIIVTPAVTAIFMSLIGMAPNVVTIGILLFIAGISSALFHVPSPVLIKNLSGEKAGRGMSLYMLGGELARSIGPMLITATVIFFSLEGIYRLMIIGIAASVILFIRIGRIPVSPNTGKENFYRGIRSTFISLAPFFLLLMGFVFFRAISKSALSTFLTLYLDEQGETIWFVNGALSIFQLAGAAGVLVSGIVSDKIGISRTLFIIACSTPVLMILFNYLGHAWILPLLVLLGFFIIASTPVLLSLVNRLNEGRPAFINGVFMTISFAIGALGDVITGILGDWFGLALTFEISGYLSFGAIPFAIALGRWDRKRSS